MAKKTLGRGLDSLFGSVGYDEKPEKKEVTDNNSSISLSKIRPNAGQPRKSFNPESIKELAESIKNYGVIQPIILKETKGSEEYIIVAGERRYRAAKMAGLDDIPAIAKDFTDSQVKEISIIENLQREDLNPVEAAQAVKKLMEEFNWTQEEVSKRLGKSRSAISNMIRILDLYPEVVDLIKKGKLSAGHAKSLVVVKDKKLQISLAQKAVNKEITVRDLEAEIKRTKSRTRNIKQKMPQTPEINDLKDRLEEFFSTKVDIQGGENKGKIVIKYTDRDDLERILDKIN